MKKLLLVAPDKKDLVEHMIHLRSEGFDFDYEKEDEKIFQRIEEESFSGIIVVHRKEWHQGITLCFHLKKQTQLPVFMVSEQSCDEAAVHMIRKGIYYFPDGSTPIYVCSIIRMYLNERTQETVSDFDTKEESDISYAIEMKESTGQLFIGGEPIKCARKTYDLWKYLLEKGDDYTSDEDIYRDVWKEEILQGYKDTIRVYIKKMRDCIPEHMKDICFIENARGIGYRFVGSYRTIKSFFFI